MNKQYKILISLLLLTFLSACGMSGPLYQEQKKQQNDVTPQVDTTVNIIKT